MDDVDIVISWVDGSDDDRSRQLQRHARAYSGKAVKGSLVKGRWEDAEQLRFCLRSIEENASWVRKIFIVTSFGQRPSWLDLNHEKICIVDDSKIMPQDSLPTFNSHAIEANLHRIPGLSEKFVYMCDDYFINQPVSHDDFFCGDKIKVFENMQIVGEKGDADVRDGYLCGIKNANALLDAAFGESTRHRIKHVAYPLTKSLYAEAWRMFSKSLSITTHAKFRSVTDVCPSSFLIPHMSMHMGAGEYSQVSVAGRRKIEQGVRDFKLGHINYGSAKSVQRLFKSLFGYPSSFENQIRHAKFLWRLRCPAT